MGLIPAETIEDIRARLDIAELVSEYVPGLQRAGRNLKGRCPFHQERTPSFIVSPERQTFHCFGCGEGGDAFKFVMKMENLGFAEAVEKLAQRVGVALELKEELGPEARERLKLKELLALAADWYHDRLSRSPDAEAARRYLDKRHVSAGSIDSWKLGYAPRSSAFCAAAMKQGWSQELLVKAGLAAPSKQRAGSLRDYFYDRLMFPILDAKGSVVAFGGRTLGDGEPKYLNSAETPVFSKSRLLYGLSKAASSVRKSRRALLMEGYMDVIAAHQHGLESACAPLGTALTSEHAALLGRYCSEAVIVFDCDDAGLNAAARGAELLLSRGLSVRIATVEGGKDPDEVLHEKGAGALRSSLEAAADLVRFKTELLIRRRDQPLSAEAKSAIAKEVLATIGQSPDEILKAEWLDRLARRLRIPVEALSREGRRLGGASRPAVARAAAEAALPGPDEELLLHVLKEPRLSALACESDFSSASARALWSALRALEPWRPGWSLALAEGLEPDSRERAQRLLVKADELIGKEAEARLRRILEKGRRERRYEELRGMLQEGGDVDATITDEFIRLSAELKGSAAAKA